MQTNIRINLRWIADWFTKTKVPLNSDIQIITTFCKYSDSVPADLDIVTNGVFYKVAL